MSSILNSYSENSAKENDLDQVVIKEEPQSAIEQIYLPDTSCFTDHFDETANSYVQADEYDIKLDDVKTFLEQSKYENAKSEDETAKSARGNETSEVVLVQTVKVEELEAGDEIVSAEEENAEVGVVNQNEESCSVQCEEEETFDGCGKDIKVECIFFEEKDFEENDEGTETVDGKCFVA